MDEIPIKFITTNEKEHKTLSKFLKSLRKIEKNDDLSEWILENIKIPFFDYLYDFVIRLSLFFILLVSFYFPLPIPIWRSLTIVLFKSIALTIAYGFVIKLKQELWRKNE